MDISLRSLLPDDFSPEHAKMHCAVYNGDDHPSRVLAEDWEEWVGWNQWRESKNDFNRKFIFSMARHRTDANLWIFGGIFEVIGRRDKPQARSYDLKFRSDLLGGYVKRLILKFDLSGRNPRRIMENSLDSITVHQVLDEPYVGEPFPGLGMINHTLAELRTIVKQNRDDWRLPLQNLKGVYVIHELTTGKSYVGAAYGENGTGIYERMRQYTESLHGGNVYLKAMVKREGKEHALNNLSFALLEYLSPRTDNQIVLARESYWMKVLMSRTHGYNDKDPVAPEA